MPPASARAIAIDRVRNFIRDKGWHFVDQTDRRMVWRKDGRELLIPRRERLEPETVFPLLVYAGATQAEAAEFIRSCQV